MKQRLTMFMISLFLFAGSALAQTKVSGTVLSQEDGQPIIGAAVKVDGTSTGMLTDVNGRFSLTLPEGKNTITVSYLGYESKTVTAKNGMRVFLKSDATALDEVVVTAMGISRQQKTLGYSAQTLDDDALTVGKLTDVTGAMAGKVAGLQVNSTSGDPGAASSVIIRGISSINGNNQPLYIVDGVPLQETKRQAMGHTRAFGGLSSINPNDIETMTVLKGAAATAIYGSRAANGVIVITTKAGKKQGEKNFQVTYDGSVQWRNVSLLPEMQNKFGQGWNGQQTFIENGSWGPEFDGSTQVYGPIWNHQQLIHEYSAVEDNIKDFFDTGVSTSHSVSLNGVSNDQKMTYFLSYSYNHDDGIIPMDKDTYARNTIAYRGSYEVTDWLKLSSSVNFANSETNTVGSYQGASMIDGVLEFPRDISLVDRKNLNTPFDTPEAWYTPYGITNPYWAIANNYDHSDSKQFFGKIQADIKPIKQVTLTYRFGFDYTDYDYKVGEPKIELDDALINEDYGYAPSNMNQSGYVYNEYTRKYELNHDFLASFVDKYLDGKLDVNVNAGVNINERYSTYMQGETDELTFDNFWQLSNGATKTDISEGQSKRRLVGLFGDITLGWDDMIYLGFTARNDWSSTLPKDANSFFYPGATLSWIFTKLIPENKILNFGKLRLAYGKTGNDADPYRIYPNFVQGTARVYYGSGVASFPMNGTNAFQASTSIGSSTLKPEMTTEFEIGTNLSLLDNRINIDFAYYNRETNDQIFSLPVDPATGYTSMVTNFGKVRNKGIELLVNLTPIRTRDFRWDLGFNFAKNDNEVVSLPESLEGGKVNIYSFSAGNDAVYMYAEQGKPMGEFYTYLPEYDDQGRIIVDANGQPVLTSEVQDTGKNVNADWTGGITTAFTYKGLSLSAALDIRKGGYMFSRSKNLAQFVGNADVTTYNDRRPFVVPNSVNEDGSENTTPIYLVNTSYQNWFNNFGAGEGGEFYLLDRSYVKLRNITLAYTLPKQIVSKLYLSDITLSLFCNNVFTWTHKANKYIDPEGSTVGSDLSGMFGELYVNPACRTFGFNVGLKF